MLRFKSIASRIVFLHVVAIALTAVFMPLVLFWLLSQETKSLHQRAMFDQAVAITRHLTMNPDGRWSLDLPPALKAQFSEAYGRYLYAVIDRDGHTMFSSSRAGLTVFPEHSLTPKTMSREIVREGSVISGVSVDREVNGRTVTVQVGEDLSHRDVLIDDVVANFFRRVGWITLPILLVLLAADIVIFRRAVEPLLEASKAAEHISPTSTDIRIPNENIPSEIRPLVKAVNQALDRLDLGFRTQREFTADAAHELRTPLALLRTRIESVSDSNVRLSLQKEVDGMSRVVSQLLDAAELEVMIVTPTDRADLRAVSSEAIEMLAPLALKQHRNIALIGSESPVWVRGNAGMLLHAIRNLVENAVSHTPPDTTVEIEVCKIGRVRVIDQGPGIAPGETALLFQRFWRRDSSRTGSAGLGLSIVKRIIEAHGGAITVSNKPSGGAVFMVDLTASRLE